MIVLWGVQRETPLAAVGAALTRFGADVAVLDQHQVLRTDVDLRSRAGRLRGHVDGPLGRVDLHRVRAMYARPFSAHQLLRGQPSDDVAVSHARRVERALWTWAELTPAVVVNRPAAMAPNQSKPFQSAAIKRAGFDVPATLVTTSPAAAHAFWELHGEIIYKSVSGVRSRVARLRPDQAHRLADVVWCPTQFQEYVAGREHRVHVVGDLVFACEIVSDADDYRYAGTRLDIRPAQLPADVADRCRRLTSDQGLVVAGLDLRRTAAGEWYCFEVNPSPAFTAFEGTSGPIGEAIARLLMQAPRPS